MDADHVADVLVEGVALPAVVDELLLVGGEARLGQHDGLAHLAGAVGVARRRQHALVGRGPAVLATFVHKKKTHTHVNVA